MWILRLSLHLCLIYVLAHFASEHSIIASAYGIPFTAKILPQEDKNENSIIARINDEIVTQRDLQERLGNRPISALNEQEKRLALASLVEEKLLLWWARKVGISTTPFEVSHEIENEKKRLGGEEKFQEYLKTIGMNQGQFRESKERYLLCSKLISKKIGESLRDDYIPPEVICKYYQEHPLEFKEKESVSIWQITLIPRTQEEKLEKKKDIESIFRHIQEGADFELLAKFYSDEKPIELTLEKDKHTLPGELKELVFSSLKEGEVSKVLEIKNTFMLIKIKKRMIQPAKTFESAQLEIRRRLESEKRQENLAMLRRELLKSTYIWPESLLKE